MLRDASLIKMVTSYFRRRVLIYDADSSPKEYKITGGVPQGSVLGPLLWNIMYDGVLRLPIPAKIRIIGFADDIAIIVTAELLEEVEQISNSTIRTVRQWLDSADLTLMKHKTEAVLISSRKKTEIVNITVGGHIITSKPHIKYLGSVLDARLSFKEHLKCVSHKAANASAALA